MSNRLAVENSPYLLQHAENPVDWYAWGAEALEKSKTEDKPIFLSIGYAACHWCHVMAHESFEDTETADLMNAKFVNIKVDREERPELDQIYMNAVVAMTGQGGWPLSVFLTPEGKPFFGGTYFPPVRRYNMPSFREVLLSVARAWENDREEILRSGEQITEHINRSSFPTAAPSAIPPEALESIAEQLANSYDWKYGGWGSAPKFPQPLSIDYLVQRAAKGDTYARDIAVHALETMALGGMYDVVGGGFARYSTDNQWLVPHFEKMLYDNALLARVYLHAHLVTGNPRFRMIVEETLDFIARELRHPAGGFFSSLDADSEGEEGKYYVWTLDQIRAAVPSEADRRLLVTAYGLTATGNFEGANVLQRQKSDPELAAEFTSTPSEINAALTRIHARLLSDRQERIPPATDDKVLTGWNGLVLTAYAEAARYLQRPDYLEIAIQNADFLLDELYTHGNLLRNWRDGSAGQPAVLEDYSSLILGLLALYQSDPNIRWFTIAEQLMDKVMDEFQDPDGGFYDTSHSHEKLIMRPKDLQDNAVPSGNSLAATALLQLAAYTGNGNWRDWVEKMLAGILPVAGRYPTAFGQWLCALHFALEPMFEVAILSKPGDPASQVLTGVLWETYRPNLVTAFANIPVPDQAPPLLQNRELVNQRPTAYVCQQFICRQPVTEAVDLREQLNRGIDV